MPDLQHPQPSRPTLIQAPGLDHQANSPITPRIEKLRRRLNRQSLCLGNWTRARAIRRLEREASLPAIQVLAAAVVEHSDLQIQRMALDSLRKLAQCGTLQAQESLCDLFLSNDHTAAGRMAVAGGFAPGDARQRALFYFLTKQWQWYEIADPDHGLLAGVYQSGSVAMRTRIARAASDGARIDWAEGMMRTLEAVSPGERKPGELDVRLNLLRRMNEVEWKALITVLAGRRRWEELWRLARQAPAAWSSTALRKLAQAGWMPQDEQERRTLVGLMRILTDPAGDPMTLPPRLKEIQLDIGDALGLAFSPDTQLLITVSGRRLLQLWKLPDGAFLKALPDHEPGCTRDALYMNVVICPNGCFAAACRWDGTVEIWDLPGATLGRSLIHLGDINGQVAFSPDGQLLAIGRWRDGVVHLCSLPDGELRKTITVAGTRTQVYRLQLAITPNSQTLICGGSGIPVRLWSLPDGEFLREFGDSYSCLSLSADGSILAAGGYTGILDLWRLRDGKLVQTFTGHKDRISNIIISQDQQVIASACEIGQQFEDWWYEVRWWSLPDGFPMGVLKKQTTDFLSFSPDSQTLTTTGVDSAFTTRRVSDGSLALDRNLYGYVQGPSLMSPSVSVNRNMERWAPERDAVSPDSTIIAGRNDMGELRLWDRRLEFLLRLPPEMLTAPDLEYLQSLLENSHVSSGERSWVRFLLALRQLALHSNTNRSD